MGACKYDVVHDTEGAVCLSASCSYTYIGSENASSSAERSGVKLIQGPTHSRNMSVFSWLASSSLHQLPVHQPACLPAQHSRSAMMTAKASLHMNFQLSDIWKGSLPGGEPHRQLLLSARWRGRVAAKEGLNAGTVLPQENEQILLWHGKWQLWSVHGLLYDGNVQRWKQSWVTTFRASHGYSHFEPRF